MVQFKYAADSPPNDRTYVRKCITDVAAEGCFGVWFDEGGVGNWKDYAGRYAGSMMDMTLKAPALDMYGKPNSWSGYTMRDWIGHAHNLGLYVITGNSSNEARYTNVNSFDVLDQVFMRETPATSAPVPAGVEIGHVGKCQVLAHGFSDAASAAAYTKGAILNGYGSAFACHDYGTLAAWYEEYFRLVVNSTPTPSTQLLRLVIQPAVGGTTNPSPETYQIPVGQQVSVKALPAAGYKFSNWNEYLNWTENPAAWSMIEAVALKPNFVADPTAPPPDVLPPTQTITLPMVIAGVALALVITVAVTKT
jgi:hypothetical protein